MNTIDSIVAANEELALAIEHYNATTSFRGFAGMSFALEEAQEDAKEQAKSGLWERFKAFFKRIKDWFFGLFKKNEDNIDHIEKAVNDLNKQQKDFTEDLKAKTEEAFKKFQEKATEDLKSKKSDYVDPLKKMAEDQQKKDEQKAKEEEEKANQAEEAKEYHKKMMDEAMEAVKKIDSILAPKKQECQKAAFDAANSVIRSFFKNRAPSIARLVAGAKGASRYTVGKVISSNLSNMVLTIEGIGGFLESLQRGEGIHLKSLDDMEKEKIDISFFKGFEEELASGNAFVENIDSASHKELLSLLKAFGGFTDEALKGGLRAAGLRRVDKALKETISITDSLVNKEGVDPSVIARIQKVYNEQVVPISVEFQKLLGMINQALKEAVRKDELASEIVMAISEGLAKASGMETYEVCSSSLYREVYNEYLKSMSR